MAPRVFGVLSALLLSAMAGASAPADLEAAEAEPSPVDDDPTIYAWEVTAPAIDSGDAGWEPGYKLYEDPRSLYCDGRKECEAFKANETAKTPPREAQR